MTVFLRIRGQLADNALIPEQDEPHDVADKRTKFYANERSGEKPVQREYIPFPSCYLLLP